MTWVDVMDAAWRSTIGTGWFLAAVFVTQYAAHGRWK